MLLDGGLEAFSIGEVARRAGVHETSVYRRWGPRPTWPSTRCSTGPGRRSRSRTRAPCVPI
ncbi:TetR family transcriptional regulator [Streptomyces sp. NPDC050523]|uniref:TetR family transcriptional regulator n=1 Tax=Streptomyces sp. NPDC050523 TaxID=3365622 RepID=UPI00378D454E